MVKVAAVIGAILLGGVVLVVGGNLVAILVALLVGGVFGAIIGAVI